MSTWCDARNLRRISEQAREAAGWPVESQEARDLALGMLDGRLLPHEIEEASDG